MQKTKNNIVAGIDIGSRTTAAVLMNEEGLLASSLIFTSYDSVGTARSALGNALENSGMCFKDIDYFVATGYGRILVPFADEHITEISCHARGAQWYFPSVRTVLDMGGQDCKAIKVDAHGNVIDFAMNDKCAAGTGRFLEGMANILRIPLEEMGPLSLKAENKVKVNSTCAVFARSEVTYLARMGIDKKDIVGGLVQAVSERVVALIKRVGIEKDFVITGGIAKNIGVVREVETRVGLKAHIPDEPQLVGGIGAALIAKDFYLLNKPSSRRSSTFETK